MSTHYVVLSLSSIHYPTSVVFSSSTYIFTAVSNIRNGHEMKQVLYLRLLFCHFIRHWKLEWLDRVIVDTWRTYIYTFINVCKSVSMKRSSLDSQDYLETAPVVYPSYRYAPIATTILLINNTTQRCHYRSRFSPQVQSMHSRLSLFFFWMVSLDYYMREFLWCM